MLMLVAAQRAGLVFSIITCAVVVYTHSKSFLARHQDQAFGSDLSVECGAESAWPHLRNDFHRR